MKVILLQSNFRQIAAKPLPRPKGEGGARKTRAKRADIFRGYKTKHVILMIHGMIDQSINNYSSSLHQDGFGQQQMDGLHQSSTSEWPDINHLTSTTATEIPPPTTESFSNEEILLWDAESLLNNVAFLEAFGSLPLQPFYSDFNSS